MRSLAGASTTRRRADATGPDLRGRVGEVVAAFLALQGVERHVIACP